MNVDEQRKIAYRKIYESLGNYFIGDDISTIKMFPPKSNGRIVKYFLEKNWAARCIEVQENRYVYKKMDAAIESHELDMAIKRLRAAKRKY